MAIEIVDFPINSMVDLSSFVFCVSLPSLPGRVNFSIYGFLNHHFTMGLKSQGGCSGSPEAHVPLRAQGGLETRGESHHRRPWWAVSMIIMIGAHL